MWASNICFSCIKWPWNDNLWQSSLLLSSFACEGSGKWGRQRGQCRLTTFTFPQPPTAPACQGNMNFCLLVSNKPVHPLLYAELLSSDPHWRQRILGNGWEKWGGSWSCGSSPVTEQPHSILGYLPLPRASTMHGEVCAADAAFQFSRPQEQKSASMKDAILWGLQLLSERVAAYLSGLNSQYKKNFFFWRIEKCQKWMRHVGASVWRAGFQYIGNLDSICQG